MNDHSHHQSTPCGASQITRRQFLKYGSSAAAFLTFLPSIQSCRAKDLLLNSLLFCATFDRGPTATSVTGSGIAQASGVRFWRVLGVGGQAMVAYPGSKLVYPAAGNIAPEHGTIELGVKLLEGFTGQTEHPFVTITAYSGQPIIQLGTTPLEEGAFVARARFQADEEHFLDLAGGVAEWRAGQWRHIALTWSKPAGQCALYLDGRKVADALFQIDLPLQEGDILIGGDSADQSAFAEIDNVCIFDAIRSESTIRDDFLAFGAEDRAIDGVNWSPGIPSMFSRDFVSPPDLMFAVISDTHVGEPGFEAQFSHPWRVEQAIAQINSLSPEFVINCGDMVTYWPSNPKYEAAARETLRMDAVFECPVYYVAGNHDIGNKFSVDAKLQPHVISDATIAAYRSYFGADYYSFDVRDSHFIVLNTQLLNSGLPSESEQWDWLVQDLETSNQQRKFIFTHLPLYWVDQDDPGIHNYEIIDEPARSRLLELVETYEVDIVFTGHTHQPIANYVPDSRLLTVSSASFARTFGTYPAPEAPAWAIIYDEWRVGYSVVRVYPDRVVVNAIETLPHAYPARALQGNNAAPLQRVLPKIASEVEDNYLGVVLDAPPALCHGMWDPSYVVDGVWDVPQGQREWHGWVSDEHMTPTENEWIAVELLEEYEIQKIEFWPRAGGWVFPVDFVVEISRDGETWETIAEEHDFPVSDSMADVSFTISPQPARHVRLRSTKMRPPETYRMSLMEFKVYDIDGIDCTRWGKCTVGSMADPRASVDDRPWQLPSNVAAKWARISPNACNRQNTQLREGKYYLPPALQRALTTGAPDDVNLVMPLATDALPSDQAMALDTFRAYIQFLFGQTFRSPIAAWEVAYGGQSEGMFYELVREARQQLDAGGLPGRLAAGPFSLSHETIVSKVGADLDAIVIHLEVSNDYEDVRAQIESWSHILGQFDRAVEVWAQISLSDVDVNESQLVAKHFARVFIAAQELGVRFFWNHVSGENAGLLDGMYDPGEVYYTAQALTTLFDASVRPDENVSVTLDDAGEGVTHRTFTNPDRVMVVCWKPVAPECDASALAVDLTVEGNYSRMVAVDVLNGVCQALNASQEGESSRISDLQVTDCPTVVVCFK